jgi:hypothetical protein
MAQVQWPTEADRKVFVEQLARFRATLTSDEQRMLDAMAICAFGTQEQGDVEGYGWFYGPGPHGPVVYYDGPTFYQTGWAPSWQATSWGAAYAEVPTGIWTP